MYSVVNGGAGWRNQARDLAENGFFFSKGIKPLVKAVMACLEYQESKGRNNRIRQTSIGSANTSKKASIEPLPEGSQAGLFGRNES